MLGVSLIEIRPLFTVSPAGGEPGFVFICCRLQLRSISRPVLASVPRVARVSVDGGRQFRRGCLIDCRSAKKRALPVSTISVRFGPTVTVIRRPFFLFFTCALLSGKWGAGGSRDCAGRGVTIARRRTSHADRDGSGGEFERRSLNKETRPRPTRRESSKADQKPLPKRPSSAFAVE